jgi:hypothetical protein
MGMFLTLDRANLKAWNLVSLNHGLGGALSSFCGASLVVTFLARHCHKC